MVNRQERRRDVRVGRTAQASSCFVHFVHALDRGIEFDGVVAFNDALALGAIRALRDAGLAVPHDVAVIGFDDIEEARFNEPTLTTVKVNLEAMAGSAVRFLLQRLDGEPAEATAVESFTSDFTIIERQSTQVA